MFSNADKKELREQFWSQFRERSKLIKNKRGYTRQWMLHRTGIRQVDLKFHADEDGAMVMIEVCRGNVEERAEIYRTVQKYSEKLEKSFGNDLFWDGDVKVSEKKAIARIGLFNNQFNIYRKEQWDDAFDWMIRHMIRLERAWREISPFVKEILASDDPFDSGVAEF
jgi:transposase